MALNKEDRTMTYRKQAFLFLFAISMLVNPSISVFADDENSVEQWQLTRLFSPTENDLKNEAKGKIFIYSGLKDIEVDRALDQNFHRMQSMMFIKTIITDLGGKPKLDEKTGIVLAENDGCD